MLRVDRLDIVKSTFGFVNKTVSPNYRVFVGDTSMSLTNLSSLPSGETSQAKVTFTRFSDFAISVVPFRCLVAAVGLEPTTTRL